MVGKLDNILLQMYHMGAVVADEHNLSIIHEDTSKDQYAELLAKETNTGLDIHCWHVENSSATMNSNCEV